MKIAKKKGEKRELQQFPFVILLIVMSSLTIFWWNKENNSNDRANVFPYELLIIETEQAGDLDKQYGCSEEQLTIMRQHYVLDLSSAVFIGDEIIHIIGSKSSNYEYAISATMELRYVFLPQGEYSLVDSFFRLTPYLKYVDARYVVDFGQKTFSGATALETVIFSDDFDRIQKSMFGGKKSLKTLKFGYVSLIGKNAFWGNSFEK